jgi:hypothetical protein
MRQHLGGTGIFFFSYPLRKEMKGAEKSVAI